jgi:serine/threonine-protein kinase
MLEVDIPDSSKVIDCFVDGSYYYKTNVSMSVSTVSDFLLLLRSINSEQRQIVIANLHNRLDAIPRYLLEEDIPF